MSKLDTVSENDRPDLLLDREESKLTESMCPSGHQKSEENVIVRKRISVFFVLCIFFISAIIFSLTQSISIFGLKTGFAAKLDVKSLFLRANPDFIIRFEAGEIRVAPATITNKSSPVVRDSSSRASSEYLISGGSVSGDLFISRTGGQDLLLTFSERSIVIESNSEIKFKATLVEPNQVVEMRDGESNTVYTADKNLPELVEFVTDAVIYRPQQVILRDVERFCTNDLWISDIRFASLNESSRANYAEVDSGILGGSINIPGLSKHYEVPSQGTLTFENLDAILLGTCFNTDQDVFPIELIGGASDAIITGRVITVDDLASLSSTKISPSIFSFIHSSSELREGVGLVVAVISLMYAGLLFFSKLY